MASPLPELFNPTALIASGLLRHSLQQAILTGDSSGTKLTKLYVGWYDFYVDLTYFFEDLSRSFAAHVHSDCRSVLQV